MWVSITKSKKASYTLPIYTGMEYTFLLQRVRLCNGKKRLRQSKTKTQQKNAKFRSSMPSVCSCWRHHLGSNSLGYSQLSRSTDSLSHCLCLVLVLWLLSCRFLPMSHNPSLPRCSSSYCILNLTITTPHHEISEPAFRVSTLITHYFKTFLGHW